MADYREAKSKRAVPDKKRLVRITIEKGKEGGHVIEHNYDSPGPTYHPPETHVFGDSEGAKALDHIASVMDIKDGDDDEGEEEGEE